jgi:hypothetical protein
LSKVATAKQTGGGGTSYEDKVIAYFLACMLSETLLLTTSFGLIKKISFQVRPDGWLFDDLLLTLNGALNEHRIGTAIRSNRQFNSNGCPKEFNQLLWQQYLHHETDIFNKDTDALCIVEAPISPAVATDLNRLLKQATYQDSLTLHQHVLTDKSYSKAAQNIYKSFYCPKDLAVLYNVKEEDTGNILKCFLQQEMDFEKMSSMDETRAIELCRTVLKIKIKKMRKNFLIRYAFCQEKFHQ